MKNFISGVIFKCLLVGFGCLVVYLIFDAVVSSEQLVSYAGEVNSNSQYSKESFGQAFQEKYIEQVVSEEEGYESGNLGQYASEINIDRSLFDATSVRLNTEIYQVAASIINKEHIEQCFGNRAETNLSKSVKKYLNPLIPIALTVPEMGGTIDTKYTWSAAIYSGSLASANVDMDSLNVAAVDSLLFSDRELWNNLACGSNCTGTERDPNHVHVSPVNGRSGNDNDSLGPLQILRSYISYAGGEVKYENCGTSCVDLMRWDDSLEWFFHEWMSYFIPSGDSWANEIEISNPYMLVAMMGIGHNGGCNYLQGRKEESYGRWSNKESAMEFCRVLSNEETIRVIRVEVDAWWEASKREIQNNSGRFNLILPGHWRDPMINRILERINIDFNGGQFWEVMDDPHKQMYPLMSIVNYMALEKLYYSGGDSGGDSEEGTAGSGNGSVQEDGQGVENTPTPTREPEASIAPTTTPRPTVTPRPTTVPRPTATPRPSTAPRPTTTPRPTPRPTEKPDTGEIEDNIIIFGDSRVVQMQDYCGNISGVQFVGVGQSKFEDWFSNGRNPLSGRTNESNIVLWLGVNDLRADRVLSLDGVTRVANMYIKKYKQLINGAWGNARKIFILDIGKTIESKEKVYYNDSRKYHSNEHIGRFNKLLRENIPGVTFISLDEAFNNGIETIDGLHYTSSQTKKIFKVVKKAVQNSYK